MQVVRYCVASVHGAPSVHATSPLAVPLALARAVTQNPWHNLSPGPPGRRPTGTQLAETRLPVVRVV